MRLWLLLLFLAALGYAQAYTAPPIHDVMWNNMNLTSSLENHYVLSDSVSSHSVSSSIDIAGMSLMLDNGTYPEDNPPDYPQLAVLVARGVHQLAPGNFICNYSYQGTVSFRFKNLSASEYLSPMPTIISVPQEMLDAMKNSSGADQLEVNVTSLMRFVPFSTGPPGSGCNDSDYTLLLLRPVSRNFTVYGTGKLFFLRAPVLGEQWFRDNLFDTIIMTQGPLYHADILLNGNLTRNLTLRTFDVFTDSYGIQELVSNLSSPSSWSETINLTTPIPLEEYSRSFAYIYEFNYSYDGLGQNDLSIIVNDSFMNSTQYNQSLLSRMLSYNGTNAEDGSPASSVPSRPSAAFTPGYMSSLELALGLLALLLILSFVNAWLLK